ncbi:MAG: 16S rRNA (cytidine(1402)-2'-O)-methyltransferase [Candidatus Omnitrophota bacterium]
MSFDINMLYIVATPIGNLKDITLRALEVLKSVNLIACEDTRRTKILLQHYNIATPTTSYFQHNRFTKGRYLLEVLKEGRSIALVSDAGTPGILDPGYHIINLAIKNQIAITAVPGPSALIDALVLSGKPAHEVIFAGFLPNRTVARKNKLRKLAEARLTLIFFESCHRILATLADVQEVFGDKEVVVARELTKKFEEIKRGSAEEILRDLQSKKVLGEFVVVV